MTTLAARKGLPILAALAVVLSGCGGPVPQPVAPPSLRAPADATPPAEAPPRAAALGVSGAALPTDPARAGTPGFARSRLTGAWVPEALANRRVLGVMVDNAYRARPARGLEQAGVVFEVLEEGGITRFLALYLEGDAGMVGPVRSTRPYFIDLQYEFDAVLTHCGQSKQAFHRIEAEHTPVINQMWTPEPFWRIPERRAPHNLYTSTRRVREIVAGKGWEKVKPHWLFGFADAEAKPAASPGSADRATIHFRYAFDNRVSYQWDAATNRYLRFLNGRPQRDPNSGRQLAPTNVVIQFIPDRVLDRKGRLELALVGEGPLWLFKDGGLVAGRWVKPGKWDATRYLAADGSTIAVNPGATWVQIVPPEKTIQYSLRGGPAGAVYASRGSEAPSVPQGDRVRPAADGDDAE